MASTTAKAPKVPKKPTVPASKSQPAGISSQTMPPRPSHPHALPANDSSGATASITGYSNVHGASTSVSVPVHNALGPLGSSAVNGASQSGAASSNAKHSTRKLAGTGGGAVSGAMQPNAAITRSATEKNRSDVRNITNSVKKLTSKVTINSDGGEVIKDCATPDDNRANSDSTSTSKAGGPARMPQQDIPAVSSGSGGSGSRNNSPRLASRGLHRSATLGSAPKHDVPQADVIQYYISEISHIRSLSSAAQPVQNGTAPQVQPATAASDDATGGNENQHAVDGQSTPMSGSEEDLCATPDEGEQELVFLRNTGNEELADTILEGKPIEEALLDEKTSTLTITQKSAVVKRVRTLNETLRKREKNKADVRTVFYTTDIGDHKTTTTSNQPAHGKNKTGKGGKSKGGRKSSSAGITELPRAVTAAAAAVPQTSGRPHREQSIFKSKGGYSLIGAAAAAAAADSSSLSKQEVAGISAKYTQDSSAAGGALPASPVATRSFYSFVMEQPESEQGSNTNGENTKSIDAIKVSVRPELQGITYADNLSPADNKRLRQFVLMEFQAICDNHNIVYASRSMKKKYRDLLFSDNNSMFGAPLDVLLEHDKKIDSSLKVPRIVKELIQYIQKYGENEEGILRINGSVARVKQFRAEVENRYNSPAPLITDKDNLTCHDAADLLKQFVRELPVPLLSPQYLEAFAQMERVPTLVERINALNMLCLLLPDSHRELLKALLQFLLRIVNNTNNMMTLSNVAIIMSPNLFYYASSSNTRSKLKGTTSQPAAALSPKEVALATGTCHVIQILINYQHVMFAVPAFMVKQVRQATTKDMIKKSKEISLKKILGRNKNKDKKAARDLARPGEIVVNAPHLTKTFAVITIDEKTTAGEVVDKFNKPESIRMMPKPEKKHKRRSPTEASSRLATDSPMFERSDTFLYEVGGNIGQRCLDHKANISAVLRHNTEASWYLKKTPTPNNSAD